MMWRDVVDLINVTTSINDIGDAVEHQTHRTVYSNRKSVRQSEFYQAAQADLRPEIMFEVRTSDYNGEPKLRHDGKLYNIIRSYTANFEITELICSGTV